MIEINRVNNRRFYIGLMLTIISLPWLILFSGVLITPVSLTRDDFLMALIPVLIEGFFIYMILRLTKNSVYRIETEGTCYRLTTLDNRQILIQPQQVKRILHGGERYVLVLENKRRLTLEKTSKYFLYTAGIDHQDPWLPFLTKERFPEAEFGSLPLA